MAQYLTLEEAAERLGISVSDFKRRLRTEWTHIRPMQDGSTQRFKDKDIEELARQIGFGSEEELTLADPSSSDEIQVPMNLTDTGSTPSGKMPSVKSGGSVADDPLVLGDQDVFLLAEDEKPKAAAGSSSKGKSDSDVRLEKSGKKPKVVDTGTDEEIDLAVMPQGGSSSKVGKSGKLTSSSSSKLKPAGKSGKLPSIPEDDSSEFELRLDPDSSDEFELSLADDRSDEVSLGELPGTSTGKSGINLGKPSDSGKSLESKKKGDSGKNKQSGKSSGRLRPVSTEGSDEEIDFELNLDPAGGSRKKSGSGKKVDSDSEFELTLDEGDLASSLDSETSALAADEDQKGDIFETDFEIPALDDDSTSEAVSLDDSDTDLDSSSDFDLAIDETGDVSVEDESASQVVVLDDETEIPAKAKKKPAKKQVVEEEESDDDLVVESAADEDAVSFDDMEVEDETSASAALRGVKGEADEEEEGQQVVVISGTAPWGPFPALFLLPTLFIVFVAGIMGYELMQSMWGYHQSTQPASVVTNQVAQMLDMKPSEGGAAGAGGAAAK